MKQSPERILNAGSLFGLCLMLLVATGRAEVVCNNTGYTYDGSCNNLAHPAWGSAGSAYARFEPAFFENGINSMRQGPNERAISNSVGKDDTSFGNPAGFPLLAVIFGQGAAHDFASTISVSGGEPDLIPLLDPEDPLYLASPLSPPAIPLGLSLLEDVGEGPWAPKNKVTHFIDGSLFYGSSEEHANKLRSFVNGKMITTEYTVEFNGRPVILRNQLPNAAMVNVTPRADLVLNNPPESLLIGGDDRVFENAFLAALHNLFVLEHNYWCDALKVSHPAWTDEQLFQEARKWTIAVFQNVLFYEFVRAVVGEVVFNQARPYMGYDETVDPRISVAFATAGFRFGHTMVPDQIPIVDMDRNRVVAEVPITGLFGNHLDPLRTQALAGGNGNLMFSLAQFSGRPVDGKLSDTVRGLGLSFDLYAVNLRRERLHGLPPFNELVKVYHPAGEAADIYLRQGCVNDDELSDEPDSLTCFTHVGGNEVTAAKLKTLYGKVKNIDGFVGMLMERKVAGSLLGQTQAAIVLDQFLRLRSGDRFWFENPGYFTEDEVATIRARTFKKMLVSNFGIPAVHLNDNVFVNGATGRL